MFLSTVALSVLAAVTAAFAVDADLDPAGVARVGVTITLRNPDPVEQEYELLFPASARAALDSFRLTDEDRPLTGKAYPATEARRIYEEIVRRRQDPALLEYMGRALFRARIFPVPARGEMRVTMRYSEPLEAGPDGLFAFRFPLAADALSVRFVECTEAPSTVYSPTHALKPVRVMSAAWRAGAGEERPAEAVVLYGFRRQTQLDARVLTYRPDPARPGYFVLLLSPSLERQGEVARDVTLVVDRSGSMAGAKWEQAKAAARRILQGARPGDRVSVIAYSDRIDALPAEGTLEELAALGATGGTNIRDAMLAALARESAESTAAGRPHSVIFLTDGLPTIGERNPERIAKAAREGRKPGTRVFVFGIGHDVNGVLLDRLALEGRGLAEYVRPDEDVEARVSALHDAIRDTALADVSVEFEGVRCFDLYPRGLADIFRGRTTVITGRYDRGTAKARVKLRGKIGAETREFAWDLAWPDATDAGNAYVGRIFANRRVGWLVDEVRLSEVEPSAGRGEGGRGFPPPPVVAEIVRLGTEFGVLTEYTSFLVEDGVDLASFDANNDRCAGELAKRTKQSSGSHGFSQAANSKSWQNAEQQRGSNTWMNERGEQEEVAGVRQIAAKTFFRRGSGWVDAAAATNAGREVIDVELFSAKYFELVEALGADARYLGAGREVTLFWGGKVYRIRERC